MEPITNRKSSKHFQYNENKNGVKKIFQEDIVYHISFPKELKRPKKLNQSKNITR